MLECSLCHATFSASVTTMYPRIKVPVEERVARRLSGKRDSTSVNEMVCPECFEKEARSLPKELLVNVIRTMLEYNEKLRQALEVIPKIPQKLPVTTKEEESKIYIYRTTDHTNNEWPM